MAAAAESLQMILRWQLANKEGDSDKGDAERNDGTDTVPLSRPCAPASTGRGGLSLERREEVTDPIGRGREQG